MFRRLFQGLTLRALPTFFLLSILSRIALTYGFSSVVRSRDPAVGHVLSASSIANGDEGNDENPSLGQCPFSKPFPRYRIDLTRFKKKDEVLSWLPLSSPLKGLSQAVDRRKIKKALREGEELIWIPTVDGVAAFSELWNTAAGLVEERTHSSALVVLPDAATQLVQNWVEIMEWMGTRMNTTALDQPAIKVELVKSTEKIFAVRMQRISNTLSLQSSKAGIDNADLINQRTQAWVKRILVENGICPFTKSVKKSGQGLADLGVPVGAIAYHASFSDNPISLFADTWRAIREMIEAGPGGKLGISSILLAAPAFDDDFDLWAGPIFAILEASVVAAQAESQVGVVCFHPQYACPDGSSWPGFGHMHSVPRLEKWYTENSKGEPKKFLKTEEIAAGGAWQRRTPHSTINVLRADQLEAAESVRVTNELYPSNIDKLVGPLGIGSDQLAQDLKREQQMGLSKQK